MLLHFVIDISQVVAIRVEQMVHIDRCLFVFVYITVAIKLFLLKASVKLSMGGRWGGGGGK